MKLFCWSQEKNEWLEEHRGVCFEDILFALENGSLLDHGMHPNQQRYPGQKIMVVEVKQYAYLVPYVETEDEIFLKTIILSRKASRDHLGNRGATHGTE
jgi:hypothetical protein